MIVLNINKAIQNITMLLQVNLFVFAIHPHNPVYERVFWCNFLDKQFSVFNVVTFPNSACGASNGYNGTCFTASECTSKVGQFWSILSYLLTLMPKASIFRRTFHFSTQPNVEGILNVAWVWGLIVATLPSLPRRTIKTFSWLPEFLQLINKSQRDIHTQK